LTKSFVFRNQNKRICGYLLQRGSEIHVQFQNRGHSARVSIVYEDGEIKSKEIARDGDETVWMDEDKGIIGAYVEQADRILMDTGEAAQCAFLQQKQRMIRNRANTEKDEMAKKLMNMHADEKGVSVTEKDRSENRKTAENEKKTDDLQKECFEMYTMPQRRWPPPALLRCPVYRNGRWIEGDTEENSDERI